MYKYFLFLQCSSTSILSQSHNKIQHDLNNIFTFNNETKYINMCFLILNIIILLSQWAIVERE